MKSADEIYRELEEDKNKRPGGWFHKKAISKTLAKAQGGMVGELKRTMRDKDLKKDHYQEFKKQHKIK